MNRIRGFSIFAVFSLMLFLSTDCTGPSLDGNGGVKKSWGTAELIETDDTGYAEYPQVACTKVSFA